MARKIFRVLFCVFDGAIISAASLSLFLASITSSLLLPFIFAVFLFINVIPDPMNFNIKRMRLRICSGGAELLCSFLIASSVALIFHVVIIFTYLSDNAIGFITFLYSCLLSVIVLSIVFWNGIIRVYATSVQLGLKRRIIGILLGFVPVANLIALIMIISVCFREVDFEDNKDKLNESRKDDCICKTRYPILLVHGVFFRDFKYLDYWGRIPKEPIKNGASVFYGEHQSASSVAEAGKELAERIKQITESTGCDKVNIIAHSKGGLDCRYSISMCGVEDSVASLTTINTPHRGCLFADYLLSGIPESVKNATAKAYNSALRKLGDDDPDFLSAVYDLTDERCSMFNETVKDSPRVYYQSVGSKLNRATNGKFPLNFTYHIAKHFDGDNDGLVSERSFKWGDSYVFLTVDGKRGISHGDMIDLNRENIEGFDVREFYVQLVNELREKGY